jgi:hypothetical protein
MSRQESDALAAENANIRYRLELFKRRHGHEFNPGNRWDDEDMFDQVMDELSSQSSMADRLYVFYHAPSPEQYAQSDMRRRWSI